MNHVHALPVNGERTPATNAPSVQQTVPLSEGEPSLIVSQTGLRFDRTHPGEESFRILKITPPRPNTPITLSTDLPDSFQLAVGVKELLFGPTLTFTPEASGTYVHVRYKPKRTGRHRAQLVVQTQNDQKTVALSGRTGGLSGIALPERPLPATKAVGAADVARQSGDTAWVGPVGNWLPKLLIGLSVAGFAFVGYINRSQIWPSRSQSVELTPATPKPARQAVVPATATTEKKRITKVTPVGAKKTAKVKTSDSNKPRAASSQMPPDGKVEERSPATRLQTSAPKPAENRPTPISPSKSVTTTKQDRTRRNPSEESELERVLNKKEDF